MLFRRHRKERREEARAVAVEKPETGAAKQAAAPAAPQKSYEETIEEYFREAMKNSIMVNKDVIIDMYRAVEKILRFAGGILYGGAKEAGKLTVKGLIEQGIVNRENDADVVFESFVIAGYADALRVERVEVDKGRTVIEVSGENLLLGSRLDKKGHLDQPLAGYMAGWLETFYGEKTKAREVACVARGDPACVFRIEIEGEHPELKKLVGRSYRRSTWLHGYEPRAAAN